MATVEASVHGHPLEAEKCPSLELSAYTEIIGVNGRVWKFRLGEYIPKIATYLKSQQNNKDATTMSMCQTRWDR